MIESWPTSASAWERAKKVLGGGVSTGLRASAKPHPLSFRSGAGARLTDVDGNDYLDYVLGWGPTIVGHGHADVARAVAAAALTGETFGAGHHLEYEVAEQVVAAIPGVERVLWNSTGSEATQLALRLARAATGRTRFVKMIGHYHGWTDSFLVGYRPDAAGRLDRAGSRGQTARALEESVLCRFNDLDDAARALRAPGADIAAVFVEPVACNSGVIPPAPGYLEGLRALCDETGTILVFDEVITGFRVAYGGAAQRYGVVPDLVTLGKAIAGGYSLAAVAGRAELIDLSTQGVVHAGTYNGNPIVLAAAAATLGILRGEGVYERLEALGVRLADGMNAALASTGIPGSVSQVGPVVQLTLDPLADRSVEDFLAADQSRYDELTVELLRRNVYALPGGRWYISTEHTATDIDETIDAIVTSLRALDPGAAPESLRKALVR